MQPAPIMLIQAANDYSIAPSYSLVDELERLQKPHLLKIYPRVGQTSGDGHNFLYIAIPRWEHAVFGFLDEYVKHQVTYARKNVFPVQPTPRKAI